MHMISSRFSLTRLLAATALCSGLAMALPAQAQLNPFVQALAIAASDQDAVATFYQQRGFVPVWTGAEDAARREILLTALAQAADHGLPVQRYDAADLIRAFRSAQTEGERGALEVRMTRAFLDFTRDLHSGALRPAKVDPGIVRDVAIIPPEVALAALNGDDLAGFLGKLAPRNPAYVQLMKARFFLLDKLSKGGWGAPAPSIGMEPGQSGETVVALRDRLIAMGYLRRSATRDYDASMQAAVTQFQLDHGLEATGIASKATLAEINVGPQERLKSILVALERERWLNGTPLGRRHIWVNLTDFTAKIIDDGKETFSTRSVIGKDVGDMRTPEFSDEMELMVINPSWSVPRSITTKEYLPLMQRNANAAGHLKIIDRRGQVVSRASINFNQYTAATFPYAMRQPPSDGNALGLVKFLFPNKYNIYLHDTPTKSLFANEVRAYSHGCIRLNDPQDFAAALLARQSDDPEGDFARILKTGAETGVRLKQHVPVHIVYFTAFPDTRGQITYRRDIYGRDAVIFDALTAAGVALDEVRS